jgi:glycosyltransferase involved in cell wall biosynthesis
VPWRDVETFYQCATALTWASRYEGCGIPVLEAMASGCPVIASDCTGITEMVGDAGMLVGPVDVDTWSGAMDLLLSDDKERSRLIDVGRKHADRFDWQTSARALLAAYEATACA